MNNTTVQTFTDVLHRKAHIVLAQIAAIEQEVRARGGSEELIATMCAPYHALLQSIYREEYPLAQDSEALPLPPAPVSVIGEVREMDLDLRRFALRQIEDLALHELRCVYRASSDEEAVAWLNKQVKVSGTVVRDEGGSAKVLAVDSVLVLQ